MVNNPPYTAKLDPTNFLKRGLSYKAVVSTGRKLWQATPGPEQLHHQFTTEGVALHGEQLECRSGGRQQ